MSEQGCLERVLQVDTRHLPTPQHYSQTRLAPTRPRKFFWMKINTEKQCAFAEE
jgi:hypothetical protein